MIRVRWKGKGCKLEHADVAGNVNENVEETYVWIGHGVERTNIQGVLVHNEKVSVLLLLDNISQLLFVFSTQVIIVSLLDTCLSEQLAPGGIIDFERLL